MSQSIVERVGKAMADAVAMNYDHNEVIFTCYAKAAIEALRDLPIGTFDTMTESLVWIKIIDKIGKDIALRK